MRIDFRITTGARAGQRELFDKSVIAIGRHPLSDLRFDANQDVDVSARHAEVRVVDDQATLRDLNSTNGTFVNGERLVGEHLLADGDVIAFGGSGPQAEFHAVTDADGVRDAETPATRLSGASSHASQAPAAGAPPVPPRRDTTLRIAEAVEQQTSQLRTIMMGFAVVLVVGVGGAWWMAQRSTASQRAQIDILLKRNDSLSQDLERTVQAMGGKVAGLDSALGASKTESDRLRSRIRGALEKGRGENVGELSARLDTAEGRQRVLVSAANVDYETIAARNGPAIVFIASEQANGDVFSGSGFNVSPSGLVVTNRHIVQDEQGRPARRIAVIFDNTRGKWLTARIVKVSATEELAFLRIEAGGGGLPVVAGVARTATLHVGAPVAIIGYPLGTSTAGMGGDISKIQPKSTLGVGTVSKTIADTLQFDAYAAEGSSGSAVFDSRGLVVGVVFGGARESNGRIVYAVPASRLAAQIPAEGAGIVK
jgi:S1-C subfamily serine protease/pSer/pThr/pTyr-binding forkhead associated (FHA) protein